MLPSPLRLWVGYADGSPVGAAASSWRWAWCLRRRAAAATGRRCCARLADLEGLPSAGLFSDMSRPGAERNGFLPVTRFTRWRRARS